MTRRLTSLRFAAIPRTAALSTRRAAALLLAGLAAAAGTHAHAQMHKVEAPEKTTRAIGVYEWTGELGKPTASRLIPISLFINGHFEDAGAYLARPVPWVLDTGNEFFIEKAGQHEGTLDLESARNYVAMRAMADDNPMGSWYGYGKFLLPAAEPKPKPLKAARVMPTIEGSDDDSRPHMTHRTPPAAPNSSGSKTSPAPSTSDSSTSRTGSSSKPADDSDRPTLARRTPATPSSTDSSSGSTTGSTTTTASNGGDSDSYDPDRPTLRHKDDDSSKKKKNNKPQGYVTGPADSLNDDPDRPKLRHGTPTDAEAAALTGMPTQLHQAVAVSDPVNHPAHVFTRAWDSESERAEVLAAVQAQARARVTTYLATNKLTPGVPGATASTTVAAIGAATSAPTIPDSGYDPNYHPVLRTKASADAAAAAAAKQAPAKPAAATSQTPAGTGTASSTTTNPTAKPATKPAAKPVAPKTPAQIAAAKRAAARKKAAAGPPQLALVNEQLSSYELSYGGLPTFIYTAEVPTAEGTTVYVTLVAQKLPSGEFQIALASLTDAQHLNRTPWMRAIDVVDPDNEHRASILMELRAQNSRQFALYRVTGPQAEQIFVTGVIE